MRAKKSGEFIVIHKDDFEHLLNCLANQKFIGEHPPCGDALAMDKEEYDSIQKENQKVIDSCYNQCVGLLFPR